MKKQRRIAISKVRPGQEFLYRGQLYRRTTVEEALGHPSQELLTDPVVKARLDRAGMHLVFCYMRTQTGKSPLSFQSKVDGEDLMVMVSVDGSPL